MPQQMGKMPQCAAGGLVPTEEDYSSVPSHEDLSRQEAASEAEERMKKSDAPQDTVERIMVKRRQALSEGGKVANDSSDLDFETPNEVDDLVLRDDLDSTYTGESSGDEIGNTQLDQDMNDPVTRIMLKRRKQSNPSPA